MKKISLACIAVLILAGGAYAYFTISDDDQQQGPATVEVEQGTLVEKALAVGEIVPRHEIAVKSKVSGPVSRVFIAEGDYVEAGADLALEGRIRDLKGFGAGIGENATGLLIGGFGAGVGKNAKGVIIGGFGAGIGKDLDEAVFGLFGAGAGVGRNFTGVGIGIAAGRNIKGITLAGVGVGAGDNITGITVGLGGVRAGGRIKGGTFSLLSVGAPELSGLTASAFNGFVFEDYWFRRHNDRTVGFSIGLVNYAPELKGIQLGLLNYAGNNPKWARLLPLINVHI